MRSSWVLLPSIARARHRNLALIISVTVFIPPILVLWFIHHYGVNVLWRDEWDEVPQLFQQFSAGHLSLSSLWLQHNEHRIVIPRIVMLLLGVPTSYNALAFMYFSAICLMGSAYAIFMVSRRQYGANGLLVFLPISFLIFNLRQFENLLWGFQIGFALAACLPVIAFALLYFITPEHYRWRFGIALSVATLATYSSAQGLLTWPAGLILLLIGRTEGRLRTRLAAAWIAIGAVASYVYFLGYAKGAEHTHLSISAGFFLTVLGGSLFGTEPAANAAAIFILSVLAIALIQSIAEKRLKPNAFWLALLFFSVLVEGAIMMGRSSFGTGQALASRYATFSILTVISAYGLISSLLIDNHNSLDLVLLTLFIGVMMGGVVTAGEDGFYSARLLRSAMDASARAIVRCESTPAMQADLAFLYPQDTAWLRRQSVVMRKLRLSTFATGVVESCDSR